MLFLYISHDVLIRFPHVSAIFLWISLPTKRHLSTDCPVMLNFRKTMCGLFWLGLTSLDLGFRFQALLLSDRSCGAVPGSAGHRRAELEVFASAIGLCCSHTLQFVPASGDRHPAYLANKHWLRGLEVSACGYIYICAYYVYTLEYVYTYVYTCIWSWNII